MRILHITTSLGKSGAGVSASIADLSAAQVRAGVDVFVFGLSKAEKIEEEHISWQGAKAKIFPTIGPEKFGFFPGLGVAIAEFCPDIIHLHGLWAFSGKAVVDWAEKTGRPYVVSAHGMFAPAALSFSPFKKDIARSLFANRVFKRASAFHATSVVERDDIRRAGLSAPVLVIPHGVILPSVTDTETTVNDHSTILSLGRLHPIKGLDKLVAAWAKLELDFPAWRLLIVGPDDLGYGGSLRAQIAELKIKNIQILPPVYGSEKEQLMATASLFVLPSLSENFAMTVAESLAVGVPVIASKAAPWQGLETERCGWWVDNDDQTSLAAALRTAMTLSEIARREMGMRGRAWMEREFSWERLARASIDAYTWLKFSGDMPDCVSLK